MENKAEILQKVLDLYNSAKKEYKERQNDPNTEKIVEAIRTATNGEFLGVGGMSTLMGWFPNYDELGRPLNCDPNYRDTTIMINGVTYPLTRCGWSAYIWLPDSNASYTMVWSTMRDKFLLTKVDLRPDYVKEYEEERKAKYYEEHPENKPSEESFEPYIKDGSIYHPKYGVGTIHDAMTEAINEDCKGRKWVSIQWKMENSSMFASIRYE